MISLRFGYFSTYLIDLKERTTGATSEKRLKPLT